MSEKFINIGNKTFTNVDKIKHIIAADADKVRRFLKKHNLDRTSMQVVDVTGDKEIRSMLLLDDNSITLSSVSTTALSKRASAYFKRSKSLLIKRYDNLEEEQKQQVNVMLYYSVNISRAYFYKEQFLKILSSKNTESAKKAMTEWIHNAENCGIPQFKKCADTMRNWYTGIINSFSTNITNGFTEGCNNKIKVLKRNAYGYRNFKRFRNRILHIFSHQQPHNEQAAA